MYLNKIIQGENQMNKRLFHTIKLIKTNHTWWLALVCIVFFFTGANGTEHKNAKPENQYKKMREAVDILWSEGKTGDSIRRLSKGLNQFPRKTYEITADLVDLCLRIEDYDQMFKYWSYGLARGYFYHLHAHGPRVNRLKARPQFEKLSKENRRLRALAQEKTKPVLDVRMPGNYVKGKKYPVLIVLHGYGRNNERMKPWFRSPLLDREYIAAFFQSSRIIGTRAFYWQVGPMSREDIKTCYRQLVRQYPVDESKIVISGMSAGAGAALDAVLHQTVPARGFILNCPAVDQLPPETLLRRSTGLGIKGTVITGERDHGFKNQEKLVKEFQKAGLEHRFIVKSNLGHRFPADFSHQLDSALAHIFELPRE